MAHHERSIEQRRILRLSSRPGTGTSAIVQKETGNPVRAAIYSPADTESAPADRVPELEMGIRDHLTRLRGRERSSV